MIYKEDILADMHTHTTFSLHAYSTVKENIDSGRKQNLKFLAITDHYYNNGDDLTKKNETNRIKFLTERVAPFESDISIIGSAEFNLGQRIEYFNKLSTLNWFPVGLHNWFVDTECITLDMLKELFLKFVFEYKCTAFNHIEREIHKIQGGLHKDKLTNEVKSFFQDIVSFAKNNNIYLEVNESTLITNECGSSARLKYWLELAKDNKNKICLGSDAHYCAEVGEFANVINLLNEVGFPKELILNCNESQLKSVFKI